MKDAQRDSRSNDENSVFITKMMESSLALDSLYSHSTPIVINPSPFSPACIIFAAKAGQHACYLGTKRGKINIICYNCVFIFIFHSYGESGLLASESAAAVPMDGMFLAADIQEQV